MNNFLKPGLVVLATAFVLYTQYHFRSTRPTSPEPLSYPSRCPQKIPEDPHGPIFIFGHEFEENEVREWYAKVKPYYVCTKKKIIRINKEQGDPLTYGQFVLALQKGYYFPELKGAGCLSDGEKLLLKQKSFGRRIKHSDSRHITVHIR